ncbi:hypothetical protein QBC39DRAFT_384012 [Podospora conica]|nr:hypothetical protein QBC39DRAFT_384012 [Schizothecium conicum]
MQSLFGAIPLVIFLFFSCFFSLPALAQDLPQGTPLPRAGWTVTADSSNGDAPPSNVLDGDPNSMWHTQWTPSNAPMPHWIQLDMGSARIVNGISILPRQDEWNNGNIGAHEVKVSVDGTAWITVAYGTYVNDKSVKRTFFTTKVARYIRIDVYDEAQSYLNPWTTIAELNVYGPWGNPPVSTFADPPPETKGRWGTTVDVPVVPAAAALASNNKLILWSAFRPDDYYEGWGLTETVEWSFGSGAQTRYALTSTGHDMFCPGISMDVNGLIVVTGGNDNKKTSNYAPGTSSWSSGAEMNLGRGYQSSTIIGDGRIFTIGGSWSGGYGGKNGEIYNSATDVWTSLPGADVARILTDDAAGAFRNDNHAWLFAWKQNTVFNAGPSKAMTWFNVSGSGSWVSAGNRATDDDAMNGIAVMYDAVAGLVLTAGGAADYQEATASVSTYVIQLGTPNTIPTVTKVGDLAYPRSYSTGTVLPDGSVLIVGGQSWPIPFAENDSQFFAELWRPSTQTWTTVAPIAVPRNYHSISILLPDATVATGGSGLCGFNCKENHFDFQIYHPPYLFDSNGELATRPAIVSVSATSRAPGQSLLVDTNGPVTFALVRHGSSTHTVNTDQRRIPLTGPRGGSTYTLTLPSDPGVLLKGYWMLFAINGAGVPSMATTIQIL